MDELSNAFRQFNPDKDGDFEADQVQQILTANQALDQDEVSNFLEEMTRNNKINGPDFIKKLYGGIIPKAKRENNKK